MDKEPQTLEQLLERLIALREDSLAAIEEAIARRDRRQANDLRRHVQKLNSMIEARGGNA